MERKKRGKRRVEKCLVGKRFDSEPWSKWLKKKKKRKEEKRKRKKRKISKRSLVSANLMDGIGEGGEI